jgi:hypothetical protein
MLDKRLFVTFEFTEEQRRAVTAKCDKFTNDHITFGRFVYEIKPAGRPEDGLLQCTIFFQGSFSAEMEEYCLNCDFREYKNLKVSTNFLAQLLRVNHPSKTEVFDLTAYGEHVNEEQPHTPLNLLPSLKKLHLKCGWAVAKSLFSKLAGGGNVQINFEMEEDGAVNRDSDFLGNLLPGSAHVNRDRERFRTGAEELKFELFMHQATFTIEGLSATITKSAASGPPEWESHIRRILEGAVQDRRFAKLDIALKNNIKYTDDDWRSTFRRVGKVEAVIFRSPAVGYFLKALYNPDGILRETGDLEFHEMKFLDSDFKLLSQLAKQRGSGLTRIAFNANIKNVKDSHKFDHLRHWISNRGCVTYV